MSLTKYPTVLSHPEENFAGSSLHRWHNQAADIQRVDEAVATLHSEMQGMRQALETLGHEIAITRADMQRGAAIPAGRAARDPNVALELMAQQVAVMSHKTSELDNLRVTVEIMKGKIYSLEQGAQSTKSASAPQGTPHTFPPSHGPSSSQAHNPTPVRALSQSLTCQSFDTVSSSNTPEVAESAQSAPSQSAGWASIIAGTKRTHMAGVELPRESAVRVPGSPKRQKTAATDPQASSAPPETLTAQDYYEDKNSDNSNPRLAVPPPTLPSPHLIPESNPATQSQHSIYASFTTKDGPYDDSWRPECQRIIEHRPRGRGRGGGPGSRGGRVRKSMPSQAHQLGTPEWKRDDCQGVLESQTGPEGYYDHVARSGRGIARRGSGQRGYSDSERATSLASQGASPGCRFGPPNDPYAYTKKTRTKPIRNQDGVLLRKDGRPDMRSQLSAANLRKVHARKEGELSTQGSTTSFTPIPLRYSASAGAPDTPSPSGHAHPDWDASLSVRQKHSAIMGKVFPTGPNETRRQYDYAHQVFEEDRDHTGHTRSQNHQSAQNKSAIRVKKEDYVEGANGGDVNMNQGDEGDHERSLSRYSEQAHDAHPEDQGAEEGEPMVSETQAAGMESEATLAASASTLQ
ncbi:hypothetical protein HBI23_256860 [Parastagonospora nodorum]|nr:hypothetical protein HBI23_256860 [Parastagonospora nodorum]KAH5619622.1 hypothetical protein HBI51_252280 [Parastagonospora nodorum]KAH5982912.1 hypothetical protein HBI84_249960 [Parastagonospora nodorum]KAH6132802.1 hypothetical protein HBI68_255350 [Parastagonospora nodorum]KAH6383066.1 hypothetical protein HBI60_258850 [Parastagonospora nodorum]